MKRLDKYWRDKCNFLFIENICSPLLEIVSKDDWQEAYLKYVPSIPLQLKHVFRLTYASRTRLLPDSLSFICFFSFC